MPKTIRAALYARVSTADQTTKNQIPALKLHVRQRGWKLAGEYIDQGISGATARRPALDRLMADARAGKLDVVLVWKFDRFARSVTHLLEALTEFRSLNVDFVSTSEAIDTSTAMGRMVFTVIGALAEFERSLIRERVLAGLQRAKAEGKHVGRPRKGIDFHRAVELHGQGWSVRRIGRELNISHATVHRILKGRQAVSKPPKLAP